MTSFLNQSFEHRNLICKVVLLTENTCHAAIIVLERANWATFGTKMLHIKSRALREFVGALFAHRSLWSFFQCCHCILDIGLIPEWWCPFAVIVLHHLICSFRMVWASGANAVFGFLLFEAYLEYVGIQGQISRFYCGLPNRWKYLKSCERIPFTERKRLSIFPDFSYLFLAFGQISGSIFLK